MGLIDDEEQKYLQEVEAVKQWWKDSRWRFTKRPFTAEQIVQKRGNLKIDYPSAVQAKKVWAIIEERFKVSGSRFSSVAQSTLTLESIRPRRPPSLMAASSPPC